MMSPKVFVTTFVLMVTPLLLLILVTHFRSARSGDFVPKAKAIDRASRSLNNTEPEEAKKAELTDTKFHFGDQVQIKSGFYKGLKGVVSSQRGSLYTVDLSAYSVVGTGHRQSEIIRHAPSAFLVNEPGIEIVEEAKRDQ